MLYSISFFSALVLLGVWFFNKENEKIARFIPALLGLSLITYTGSVAFASAGIPDKLFTAFRDFLVLGGTSMAFMFFSKTKYTFLPVLLVSLLLYMWYNEKIMSHTFDGDLSNVPIADEAELLIEISENETPADLKDIMDEYGLELSRAFTPKTRLPPNWMIITL